jgi:hypothetical protein
MDATEAMGNSREGPAAEFCGRLFLMLDGRAFLIVDRVKLPFEGRVESRMHTYAEADFGRDGADLERGGVQVAVRYGCSVSASLYRAVSAPTTPGRPSTMLRWCTEGLEQEVTMATLLCRGAAAKLKVDTSDDHLTVVCCSPGWKRKITLSRPLRLAEMTVE